MYYLKVAWLDNSDDDYYSFPSLELAVKFIIEEGSVNWVLSDKPFDGFPLDDYEFHPEE